MDYPEEQESEIEALESIYPTEFKLITDTPYTFTIWIKSEKYDNGENGLSTTLKFTLPQKYPEEIPIVQIMAPETDDEDEGQDEPQENYEHNLEPEHTEGLQQFIQKIANDNVGMAMVFSIVSEAQEWLSTIYEKELKEREDEEERRFLAAEEAERNRFEGTRVNVVNFMEWKKKFDAEVALRRKAQLDKEKELIGNKLTGRELFLKDNTMNESDLKFVEEGEVAIDESLFEDLDDLDIGDEEVDDENGDDDDD